MIAHCIGGPWHGEDREVKYRPARLFGANQQLRVCWDTLDPEFTALIPFETFEYEYAGVAAGIDIYEYIEPTAEVEIVIRKRVPKSKVEETCAELVRTLDMPPGGRLHYSGPARD